MSFKCSGYKDRERYKEMKKREKRRYYGKTQGRIPKRWDEWEDDLITDCPKTDMEMADFLHRSMASIQVRRWRLKYNKI
jgi:hypothetical protein